MYNIYMLSFSIYICVCVLSIYIHINIYIYIYLCFPYIYTFHIYICFPGSPVEKEFSCQCSRLKRYGFDLWVGKIPWRRKWQPTPVFLPGKFHGQRSLEGFSP